MKYSEFIYQCAKQGSGYGESEVNYHTFLLGACSQPDYATYLDKAFHEANAFLQRISALGKVPCRIKEFEAIGSGVAELEMDSEDFLKPVAVFQYRDKDKRDYDNMPFRKIGNKVQVLGSYSPYRKIYVQYRPKIKYFRPSDVVFITSNADNSTYSTAESSYYVEGTQYDTFDEAFEAAEEKQFDLTAEYGISDELLSIGIDFVKGRINDDASQGHSQEMEAESRLNDFEPDEFVFLQTKGGRVKV